MHPPLSFFHRSFTRKRKTDMLRTLGSLSLLLVLLPFSVTAQAQLAPAEAGVFMGSWTLALDTPQGGFEQSLVLKEDAGTVVGEISSQRQPEVQRITDVTKKGEDLVLKYAVNMQGNAFDATITLTPEGTDKCKVAFDINGGQFTLNGTGTKK